MTTDRFLEHVQRRRYPSESSIGARSPFAVGRRYAGDVVSRIREEQARRGLPPPAASRLPELQALIDPPHRGLRRPGGWHPRTRLAEDMLALSSVVAPGTNGTKYVQPRSVCRAVPAADRSRRRIRCHPRRGPTGMTSRPCPGRSWLTSVSGMEAAAAATNIASKGASSTQPA